MAWVKEIEGEVDEKASDLRLTFFVKDGKSTLANRDAELDESRRNGYECREWNLSPCLDVGQRDGMTSHVTIGPSARS